MSHYEADYNHYEAPNPIMIRSEHPIRFRRLRIRLKNMMGPASHLVSLILNLISSRSKRPKRILESERPEAPKARARVLRVRPHAASASAGRSPGEARSPAAAPGAR